MNTTTSKGAYLTTLTATAANCRAAETTASLSVRNAVMLLLNVAMATVVFSGCGCSGFAAK